MFVRGMRPDIPKTLIYITDGHCSGNPPRSGNCTDDARFRFYGDGFRNRNITVFGVGVGSNINEQQIKLVLDNDRNYRKADTFTDLMTKEFVRNISLCPGMYMQYFNKISMMSDHYLSYQILLSPMTLVRHI